MLFDELLEEAINQKGGKGLASEMGCSPSDITKFRSNQTGLTLPKINQLLEICGYTLSRKDERDKLIDMFMTVTDLYKAERK
ncbi:MAG: hypothetical protein V1897_15170 [Pseudomonadota bacterium]